MFHWCLLAYRQCDEWTFSHMSTFLSGTRPLLHFCMWISKQLKSCDRGGQLLGNSTAALPATSGTASIVEVHSQIGSTCTLVFWRARRPAGSSARIQRYRIDCTCQLSIKKNDPMSSLPIISGCTLAKTDNGNSLTPYREDWHRCGSPVRLVGE
jgi:hypothetical protein